MVHIERIGCTPLKGGRHLEHEALALRPHGPLGDRVFCVVDPVRNQVLRTVANPTMLQVVARWDGQRLSVLVDGQEVAGVPEGTGRQVSADYWGRPARLEVVAGPWAHALSAHLDRDVVLARVSRPGEVVYGAAISMVTTSSLRRLARTVGLPVDAARFRATLVLDTGDAPGGIEQRWAGAELHLGSARVRVGRGIGRCGVVDLDPLWGRRDGRLLTALARERNGGPVFGVDAVVTTPATVRTGDPVHLG